MSGSSQPVKKNVMMKSTNEKEANTGRWSWSTKKLEVEKPIQRKKKRKPRKPKISGIEEPQKAEICLMDTTTVKEINEKKANENVGKKDKDDDEEEEEEEEEVDEDVDEETKLRNSFFNSINKKLIKNDYDLKPGYSGKQFEPPVESWAMDLYRKAVHERKYEAIIKKQKQNKN